MSPPAPPAPVSVLFVCLGNICRSTMAEGVFQSLTRPASGPAHPLIASIDSCGTGGYHAGDSPDSRTMATLRAHGITTYRHAARQVSLDDFAKFDYILAMDDSNLHNLEQLRKKAVQPAGSKKGLGEVKLFGEFGGKTRRGGRAEEIEDPYYGGDDGFETAYKQSVLFSKVFLERLEKGKLPRVVDTPR